MKKPLVNTPQFPLIVPSIMLLIAISIIGINISSLAKEIKTIVQARKLGPFPFPGYKYKGLESVFKNVKSVGYYTDKNIDDDETAKELAQAQFMLAPTILDIGNLNHEFILLQCTSDNAALKKMAEIQAAPIKRNQFGVYLAQRKL